ncbi:MAG TPA: peptidoglycan DD-metalloendopeptidase family protein [Steroidobacteraceae bacterium]|nr:peptidoglycan DD-metalloendopeptidase family protein [Steroidobacteraceae bacterium]
MTFSFKPAIRKWASLGLASCLLAACHHETQQGTSAAAHTQPRSGQLTQRQAIEQSSPTATAGGDSAAAAGARTTAVANIAGAGGTTTAGATAAAGAAAATIDIVVGRNDTLDRIFRKLQLNLSDLANLRSMPGIKTHMDNLRLGESLHFVYRDDELDGFERRLNENETLKVIRGPGGLRADVLQNPLEGRTRTVRGVIDRSLFEAVTAAGAHDQTAVNLADMFQWDIDFILDVQPGDSFVVTYRELYQNGVYVKDGPVLAASFVNQGRPYFAVRYVDSEGAARYFTPDGRSLHKAFLRAPVEFTRISSRFNSARHHPILNLIRAHKGIDYAAPMGTPVRAAGDGRVGYAGPKGGYGNVVEIEHSRSITTVYGHLSRFAKGTRAGAHVTQGQVIAYVGMTGLATGPHLHYEYRVNGVFKNPQTVPLPDASPIEARFREDFLAKSAPLLATLQAPIGPALVSR